MENHLKEEVKASTLLDVDTQKLNSLTLEVETLKASLQYERQAAEDLRKALSKSEARNMKLAAKLENATKKVEEKASNLVENQELLIKCISQNLGYVEGKPVAACVIYKCLLQWKSFESARSNIFNRIIQTIASAIEVPDNNEVLAYWLSNSATLSSLLHRTLKRSTHNVGSFPARERLGKLEAMRQVEPKYPALVFKHQLTALLEKIYELIRDHLKTEITPILKLCIEAPRTSRTNVVTRKDLIGYWQSIRRILNTYLNLMKAYNVPPFLVRKVFIQIFSFINVQLFNSFLLRREYCSFSNGEYVKEGLAELEQWCIESTNEYAGSAWDELKHTRKAVDFLVIQEKPKKTFDEMKRGFFPVLNIKHLYRISTMFRDDKFNTHSVSSDVITKMRIMLEVESDNVVRSSFLLDDDSSIPFAVEDISNSMGQVDVNINIQPLRLTKEAIYHTIA